MFQWPQEQPCPKAYASLERVIEIQSKKRSLNCQKPMRSYLLNFLSVFLSLTVSLQVNTGPVSRVCLRPVDTRYSTAPWGLKASQRRMRRKRSAPWRLWALMLSSQALFLIAQKPAGQQCTVKALCYRARRACMSSKNISVVIHNKMKWIMFSNKFSGLYLFIYVVLLWPSLRSTEEPMEEEPIL